MRRYVGRRDPQQTAAVERHRLVRKFTGKYGGVIPELASRAHQQNIIPVVDTAIREAGIGTSEIDGIAFTRGPGLLGSLLVGVSFAKGLALSLDVPMMEINHLQGHIFSHFIDLPDRELPASRASRSSACSCRAATRRSCCVKDYARDGDHRHDDRRRRRRSVRQVRQGHGPALPRRPGDRPTGQGGRPEARSSSPNRRSTASTTASAG